MVDFEKIGRRITEQRRMLHITQTRMSMDLQDHYLSLHQSDISRLEKAAKGSGITDLSKLDIIADYLCIPLETLIFGIGGGTMQKYYGSQMTLRASKKKPKKSHSKVLSKLTDLSEDQLGDVGLKTYECGLYTLYSVFELQAPTMASAPTTQSGEPIMSHPLQTYRTYIFYDEELVAVAVTAMTCVEDHFFGPDTDGLELVYRNDAVDPTDVYRTMNPYWALWKYSTDADEKAGYLAQMSARENELRGMAGSNLVLYVESVYVREDCRQNGIFRMYIDFLKTLSDEEDGDPIIWLCMEPTAGIELEQQNRTLPSYTVSDLGQININAAIAEKVGFKVDPASCYREGVVLNEDGSTSIERVQVRKNAYMLPAEYKELLANDGNLVADGRAKQHLADQDTEDRHMMDLKQGPVDGYEVVEIRNICIAGPHNGERMIYYAARSMNDDDKVLFGVSKKSVVDEGLFHDGQIEQYDNVEAAKESEHWQNMGFAYQWILGLPSPDMEIDAEIEELEPGDDVGLEYLNRIGFQNRKGTDAMALELVKLYGEKKAMALFDERSKVPDGSVEFYEFKNQDIGVSAVISECYDADTLRQMCNYLYENREYIKGRVLEIGCESGYMTGFLATYFPDVEITAIDRSANAVAIAKERMEQWGIKNVRFLVADVADIEEQFDTVLSLRVMRENDPDNLGEGVFDGDDILCQVFCYMIQWQPFAGAYGRLLGQGSHLITIERIPLSPQIFGWYCALNGSGCGLIKETYENLYCKEVGETAYYSAAVLKGSVEDDMRETLQCMMDSLKNADDEFNFNHIEDGHMKGWPAIAFFDSNKGDCIEDIMVVGDDDMAVGRFAAYIDAADPTAVLYLEVYNDFTQMQLGRFDISIKDEVVERIDQIREQHNELGFNIVPAAEYYEDDEGNEDDE